MGGYGEKIKIGIMKTAYPSCHKYL